MKLLLPALVTTALLLTACSDHKKADEGRVEGPAVAPSESPRNPAVDTGGTEPLTPGANSFTEAQARSAIEKKGYTAIGPLSQDTQGIWSATATKNGAKTKVSVDYKGEVVAG
ncbi:MULTISPECIES: hypothetical protein [unclassified Brevundimonas]|uniref:hypothetical protein n=1 Tax=unclassified Brevundimonas TaxID=2622653 RepID=UPI003F8DDFB7